MNCNRYSTLLLRKDYKTTSCNRAKLDTGTFCNYDCEFCYYQGLLHVKTDFETIKNRIDTIYEYGIEQIDLSGGESSVHKNWFDILQYCENKFSNISTLSNGWAFAKEKFLLDSKNAGLDEILFSVHGYDEQSHDAIVRRKGAWKRIMKAIANAKRNGIVVRVNCTLYQKNLPGFDSYHKVLSEIAPHEVNFLTLNYWTNNSHAEPIDYKLATDKLKDCIDRIKSVVKYINVRYTPYCYMVGYEKYVCNNYQHIYDIYDWNKEIYDYNIDTTKKYTHEQKIDLAFAAASEIRNNDYYKPAACMKCKFFNICDGPEKQVKQFKCIPVPGKKIVDVNHYRRDFYDS